MVQYANGNIDTDTLNDHSNCIFFGDFNENYTYHNDSSLGYGDADVIHTTYRVHIRGAHF